MDTLKEYRDIVVILLEQAKADSKHNKLLKIWLKTEDTVLKDLLGQVVTMYGKYIKPGVFRNGSPCNYTAWCLMINPLKKNLKEYCEDILNTQKPQWQIIAERNGWGPLSR